MQFWYEERDLTLAQEEPMSSRWGLLRHANLLTWAIWKSCKIVTTSKKVTKLWRVGTEAKALYHFNGNPKPNKIFRPIKSLQNCDDQSKYYILHLVQSNPYKIWRPIKILQQTWRPIKTLGKRKRLWRRKKIEFIESFEDMENCIESEIFALHVRWRWPQHQNVIQQFSFKRFFLASISFANICLHILLRK